MKTSWLSSIAMYALLLLSVRAFAQQKNEFSIKQCVEYATKNAVTVKNALLDVKIQNQVNRQVTSAAFPQVNGSIGTQHYFDIPVTSLPDFISPSVYQVLIDKGVKDGSGQPIAMPAGGFGVIPAQFGVPWTASGGIDVSQLLFDGQVFVGLMARKAALDYYQKTADVTQEQIKANVYKIYYQLVVGKKQLATVEDNVQRISKLLRDTKIIHDNGFAEQLDVDKSEVQLSNLKTEKTKIENMLAVGNAGLKFLIGMPQKDELILTDTLGEEELKANILDSNYDYKDRKEMQLLTVAEKLGNYNVKRYQLSKIPTIAAFASYSKNAQRSSFNFFNKGDWFTTSIVGFKMNIPIFDGNSRNAHIQQSRLELQKTRNTMEQLKQSIDYDVSSNRIKMTSALLTVDEQKKNMELAEKVYNVTKKKYEQGLGSNQEIYTSQIQLSQAQANYYGSLYDAISAKVDWLKATGKL
ncbi:MAG: TolC family protein [Bacteroidetes bacterium]|nr:TolC family protein [Bacteroidota bacterium]